MSQLLLFFIELNSTYLVASKSTMINSKSVATGWQLSDPFFDASWNVCLPHLICTWMLSNCTCDLVRHYSLDLICVWPNAD